MAPIAPIAPPLAGARSVSVSAWYHSGPPHDAGPLELLPLGLPGESDAGRGRAGEPAPPCEVFRAVRVKDGPRQTQQMQLQP
jgi:hypothetical protein